MSFSNFSDWIDARLLALRRPADPDVDRRVARLAGGVVARIPGADLRGYLAQRIPRFPRNVVGAILRDGALAETLELSSAPRRELSGVVFAAEGYWDVLCMAMGGSPVQLASEDGRVFDVRLASRLGQYGPWPHVAFVNEDNVVFDTDWRIEMACGDEQAVRASVDAQRSRLELTENETDALVMRLMAVGPRERISITDRMEQELPVNFYEIVRDRIKARRSFTPRDLVPEHLDGLPRRLGFILGSESIEQAAVELLQRVGPIEALGRWCALPVNLPEPLLAALGEAADPVSIVTPLLQTTMAPVSLLHNVRLAGFLNDGTKCVVSDELLNRAVDEYRRGSFSLHLALLRWFANDFSRNPSFAGWDLRVRLAVLWQHTHEVMRLLTDLQVPRDFAERAFAARAEHDEEALLAPVAQLRDIAHPLNVSALNLLLYGVAIARKAGGLEISAAIKKSLLCEVTGSPATTNQWNHDLYAGAGCSDSLGSFLAGDIVETLRLVLGEDDSRPALKLDSLSDRMEAFIAAPTAEDALYIANRIGWLIEDQRLLALALDLLEAPLVAELRTPELGPWHVLQLTLSRFAAFASESARQRARTAIVQNLTKLSDFGPPDFALGKSAFVWLARSREPQTTLGAYFADLRLLAGRDARSDLALRRIAEFAKARLPARLVPKELSEVELFLRMIA